jgi:hypothetical protein
VSTATRPAASRTSRLRRRLRALARGERRWSETSTPLELLTTDELRSVLELVERGGVLPSGHVRCPEAFLASPPQESEALERWRQLCGEPLDHLEAAEELLDRAGEARGWYSREAVQAALLLARLELPDASPWFVGKRAEAVLTLYAELEEHRNEPQRHPHVRGAVRRLERLEEMGSPAPSPGSADAEYPEDPQEGALRRLSERYQNSLEHRRLGPRGAGGISERRRDPWWRKVFGSKS